MIDQIIVKTLVYQPTGHVVWMLTAAAGTESVITYIPNLDNTLDYKVYVGPRPTKFDIRKAFVNYTLIKDDTPGKISTGPLADHHLSAVKLSRAKCFAAQIIRNILKFQDEKHNTTTGPWAIDGLDLNIIAGPIKRYYNLNDVDAKKFAKFKQQEINLISSKINAAKLDAELRIMQAKSIEELLERFELIKAYSMINPEFNLRALSVNFTCT